ncbi:hypothetical protein, partial [Porphyromonas cangingivalis]|uniref:hypothetical protein n=1 Tax=Porphyromonas cangingivalis TaxID=36874 RepID=UPI00056BC09A
YLRYIRGVDGASAYQVWKDAVEKGTITWAGSKDTDGFFLYLKGEKGENGEPGKNGATAYEVWKEFIKNGDVLILIIQPNSGIRITIVRSHSGNSLPDLRVRRVTTVQMY